MPSYFPARLVCRHAGFGAYPPHQYLITRLRFAGHPGNGLAQSTTTHPQPKGLLQHARGLAVRQSQIFIQLRRQSQSTGPDSHSRTPHRIRTLSLMPPLHPLSALRAPSYMKAKLRPFYPGCRNLLLVLRHHSNFFYLSLAVGTVLRQRHLHRFLYGCRNRSPTPPPIGSSSLTARRLRIGFGLLSRERGCLSFACPHSFFEQLFQPLNF